MDDKQRQRLEEFVSPFRVKPGSSVNLDRDFGPAFKGGVKKKEGRALLAEGVQMLAEYQARLAAQDTWGVLVVLQASLSLIAGLSAIPFGIVEPGFRVLSVLTILVAVMMFWLARNLRRGRRWASPLPCDGPAPSADCQSAKLLGCGGCTDRGHG